MKKIFTFILLFFIVVTTGYRCSSFAGFSGDDYYGGDVYCEYGCPNSKRVKKLNLFKKKKTMV